jgi:hypothetical protein
VGRLAIVVALVLAVSQAEAGCTPTGSGGSAGGAGTATTTCPIPNPYKVDVTAGAPGEVSSVTVKPGSDAVDERTGTAWCDLTELKLTKLGVAAAVASNGCPTAPAATALPCTPYGMLAAVDLRPTPISFPTQTSHPDLVYDLVSNPPQKECDNCGLAVYQLREPPVSGMSNWRWVGSAYRSTAGSRAIATANLNHFSVFALVELPPPAAVNPGAADAVLIVGSDFIAEGETTLTVQLAFVEGRLDAPWQLDRETSLLYRFDHFDPTSIPSDGGCAGTPAEIMTCLFPIETEVRLQVLERSVVLERVVDGFRVEFAAAVEVF